MKVLTLFTFAYLFVCIIFGDTVSLSIPSWYGTHCIDETDLELAEIHLPGHSKCWD